MVVRHAPDRQSIKPIVCPAHPGEVTTVDPLNTQNLDRMTFCYQGFSHPVCLDFSASPVTRWKVMYAN